MLAFGSWISRLTLRGRFPLLLKELTEMAARRRTYIVRVVYAVLLFGIYGLILKEALKNYQGGSIYGIIGRGSEVFIGAMVLQFGGLFLFLPAMMSTAITAEKERDALPLIMLTDLRPWEILLEKYVGRMVPMAVFLLLGMPLVALAYSLGGVSLGQILYLAWFLFVALLQVGAFSLMVSAWCRTSVSAFIASYLGLAALYIGPPLLIFAMLGMYGVFSEEVALALCPPAAMMKPGAGPSFHNLSGTSGAGAHFLLLLFGNAFLSSLPILASTAVFLGLARAFLVRRAFVKPRNYVLAFFRRLDAIFTALNTITGGIVLVGDKSGLPGDRPVYWREISRKSLGRLNYLLRILLVIEMPVLLISMTAVYSGHRSGDIEGFSALLFLLWPLVALAVVVRGADAVPSERSAQTLGVLMTTPMSGAEIIKEKMSAVRRLAIVGSVPLLTVIVIERASEYSASYRYSGHDIGGGIYLIGSLLTVAIYLPMLYWLGLFIGGKMRSRAKAIVTALIILVLLCVTVPSLLVGLAIWFDSRIDDPPLSLLFLGSPATMIVALEFGEVAREMSGDAGNVVYAIAANCLLYGGLWLALRTWCLRRADAILGRTAARTHELRMENGE